MKKFIGLGCSWVAGEGGYPKEIWEKYNGRCNVIMGSQDDEFLRPYELENSWVNVICKEYLTDYKPINLGQRGLGIRGAVHQLYLTKDIDWENDTGIICLLLPHPTRINLYNREKHRQHYNWQTLWTSQGDKFDPKLIKTEQEWFEYIWMTRIYSDYMSCYEAVMSIYAAQVFAERYGFKFIFANAYIENMSVREYFKLYDVEEYLLDKINWNSYFPTTDKNYKCFQEQLVNLDGFLPENTHYWGYYQNLPWPGTYLTNCIHPNIEGYKVIAKELYNFIVDKNLE